MIQAVELKANIHHEGGSYWANVSELPGCFAAGDSLDELLDSLKEGIELYLGESGAGVERGRLELVSAVLSDSAFA